MKTTVITHIYNEEYLLPFWLEHHSTIFDHGIIIDYRSTDSSLEICRKICPTWTIITSRNIMFAAHDVDKEVMDIENSCDGIKIALNTSEFFFSDSPIKDIFKLSNNINTSFAVFSTTPYSLNIFYPKDLKELIQSLLSPEVLYIKGNRPGGPHRFIHNYANGNYMCGRHISNNPWELTEKFQIIWLGYYPWNEPFKTRKLNVKTKVPEHDKICGIGYQHLYTIEKMEEMLQEGYKNGDKLEIVNNELSYMIKNKFI
jgi:hypothetical protein